MGAFDWLFFLGGGGETVKDCCQKVKNIGLARAHIVIQSEQTANYSSC